MRSAVALLITALTSSSVHADAYHYCFAKVIVKKIVIVTKVFYTNNTGLNLQSAFRQRIEDRGISIGSTLCPGDRNEDASVYSRRILINAMESDGYDVVNVGG